MITAILGSAQVALGAGSLACGAWWTTLSVIALKRPDRRAPATVPGGMVTIVPAHNEEALVARTVRSLLAAGGDVEVLVVADNCDDATAEQARAAGAVVLERFDGQLRGKSHALEFGLGALRRRTTAPSAVVIVDADSEVSPGFFAAVGGRLADGADAVQAYYAAAPSDTPVGRLRRLAFALVHWSRPLGASRLGLPTTLKGNGMAFAWEVIRDGFPGSGITEDAAATLGLAKHGVVVEFAPEASVTGLMAQDYAEAGTQDRRWEGGRMAMMPRALAVAFRQLARGRIRAAAAAAELASPPLTLAGGAAGVALALSLLGFGSAVLGTAAVALVGAYIVVGLAAARPEPGDLAALVHAPRFVAHKALTYAKLLRGQPRSWERTTR